MQDLKQSKGDYIITMDGDLQDSPEEIHKMVGTIKEKKLDLISGWKKKDMTLFYLRIYLQNYLIWLQE